MIIIQWLCYGGLEVSLQIEVNSCGFLNIGLHEITENVLVGVKAW